MARLFQRELGGSPRRGRDALDQLIYRRSPPTSASPPAVFGTGSVFSDAAGFVGGAFSGGAILSTILGPTGVIAGSILGAAFHQDIGDAAIWFVRNVVDNPLIVQIVSIASILSRGVPVIGPALSYSTLYAYTGIRIVGDLSARVFSGDRMTMSDIKRVVLGAAANAPILSSIPEYERITNDCRKVELFLDEGIDHFRSQCPGGVVTLDCLTRIKDQMPTPDEYSGSDADEVLAKIRSLDPAGFAKAEELVQKYNGNEEGMLGAWQAGKIESIIPPEYQSQFMADYNALLQAEASPALWSGGSAYLADSGVAQLRASTHQILARPGGLPVPHQAAMDMATIAPNTIETVPASKVPKTTTAIAPPGSAYVRLKTKAPPPQGIGDEIFLFIESIVKSIERLIGLGGGAA